MRKHDASSLRAARTPRVESLEQREVLSSTGFVTGLYQDVLHRTASAAEVQSWVTLLDSGQMDRASVAWGFWNSVEHRTMEVDQLYTSLLNRSADTPGEQLYVGRLLNGTNLSDVELEFLSSPEYQSLHPTDASFVDGVYKAVLNRAPDSGGLNTYLTALSNGMSRYDAAGTILYSNEGSLYTVDRLYTTLLHRQGDADGLLFYGQRFQTGYYWVDDVAVAMLSSGEYDRLHP